MTAAAAALGGRDRDIYIYIYDVRQCLMEEDYAMKGYRSTTKHINTFIYIYIHTSVYERENEREREEKGGGGDWVRWEEYTGVMVWRWQRAMMKREAQRLLPTTHQLQVSAMFPPWHSRGGSRIPVSSPSP